MNVASSIRYLSAASLLKFFLPSIGLAAGAGPVELISVGIGGVPANGDSYSGAAPSANGRFVVFNSLASNLVGNDTNGEQDVFVRDRKKHITRLVSLGQGGVQGNDVSGGGVISPNGRFVAFQSDASNLVQGDTNGVGDVFVRDLRTGTTKRISVATGGKQANGKSSLPSFSANGRYVAFPSDATNLVPGDTNGETDIFLHDRRTNATFRVSLGAAFGQANGPSTRAVLSRDARFVAFQSTASNLVAGDTNDSFDVFVRDRRNDTTTRVSVSQSGAQGNSASLRPSMSPNGRYVAFDSFASNLVPRDTNRTSDIFVRDLQSNKTNRVSLGAGFAQSPKGSFAPSISADGKRVAYDSIDDKIYLRDRRAIATEQLDVPLPGVPGGDFSGGAEISANGKIVVFHSLAANLVRGDTNGLQDVFVATP